MELIIVIFFFSLTAAVCLRLFVKSHVLGRDTRELNDAILWAENTRELFYEYGEDFTENCMDIYSDVKDDYEVKVDISSDDSFIYLDFVYLYTPDSREIYNISFKKHIKEVKD